MKMQKNMSAKSVAPGRIDLADTIDLPQLFMKLPGNKYSTFNVAIDWDIEIKFDPLESDQILKIEHGESYLIDNDEIPLITDSYFERCVRFFCAPAGRYTISSRIPLKSGLGGSSAYLVCLIGLIFKLKKSNLSSVSEKNRILNSAYLFENSIGETSAGFQDFLAALYGGANSWTWGVESGFDITFAKRTDLLQQFDRHAYRDCLLLCYTGIPHGSNKLNVSPSDWNSTKKLKGWIEIGTLGNEFSTCFANQDWELAHLVSQSERKLRLNLMGETLSDKVSILVEAAEDLGIACRFAGVGNGGTAWAASSPSKILALELCWQEICKDWIGSDICRPTIHSGHSVELIEF